MGSESAVLLVEIKETELFKVIFVLLDPPDKIFSLDRELYVILNMPHKNKSVTKNTKLNFTNFNL